MATEKRLIDANDFHDYLEVIRQDYLEEDTLSRNFAAKVIETVLDEYLANAPAVDAVEVVHGHWIPTECGTMCSSCHRVFDNDFEIRRSVCRELKICPDCGAKMDGERRTDEKQT